MATASAIVGQHMIIPLLTTFHPEEDINWVKIDQEVNAGMIANPCYEHRKTIVPKFSKPDIKLLCHNIHEFSILQMEFLLLHGLNIINKLGVHCLKIHGMQL